MSETWKKITLDHYEKVIEKLVHFCSKTVNSNANMVAIRLDKEQALNLPYISLRTLMGGDKVFPLDYAEGGAGIAGVTKQINQILENSPEAAEASEEEKKAVIEAVKNSQNTA